MFNMGFSEMIVLAIIALVVIGPKQLPEVARVIARMLNEFKRATKEVSNPLKDLKSETNSIVSETADQIKKNLHVDGLDDLPNLNLLDSANNNLDKKAANIGSEARQGVQAEKTASLEQSKETGVSVAGKTDDEQ